jgi:hypothetical protein
VGIRTSCCFTIHADTEAQALNLARLASTPLVEGVSLYDLGNDARDQRLYLQDDEFQVDDIIEDDIDREV